MRFFSVAVGLSVTNKFPLPSLPTPGGLREVTVPIGCHPHIWVSSVRGFCSVEDLAFPPAWPLSDLHTFFPTFLLSFNRQTAAIPCAPCLPVRHPCRILLRPLVGQANRSRYCPVAFFFLIVHVRTRIIATHMFATGSATLHCRPHLPLPRPAPCFCLYWVHNRLVRVDVPGRLIFIPSRPAADRRSLTAETQIFALRPASRFRCTSEALPRISSII